jgi:hypothetical protein
VSVVWTALALVDVLELYPLRQDVGRRRLERAQSFESPIKRHRRGLSFTSRLG